MHNRDSNPNPYSVHPECPDWRHLGPNDQEAALRALGDAVKADEQDRRRQWSRGFTRRQVLAGGLGVGVAALAQQLVTTRVSYAASPQLGGSGGTGGTLVVVFLRGGMDGLSVLVPADDPNLLSARPDIAVRAGSLIQFDSRFGLHPALGALQPMLNAGKIAAVPDIATPHLSRSHFQAQDCLERGGQNTTETRGWLDRVLEEHGEGTTFRALSVTSTLTRSLSGTQNSLVARKLDSLELNAHDSMRDRTIDAITDLYTKVDHPFKIQANIALEANAKVKELMAAAAVAVGESAFPKGDFGSDLATLSQLIRAEAGVRVATIDVGGWDMHTAIGDVEKGDMRDALQGIGDVEKGDMRDALQGIGDGLAAFFADLGDKADSTTVVLMSEFGRRTEQNGSGGTDHGHGGLAMAIGAGVKGGVYGTWNGLDGGQLTEGDLPGNNDFRNFLGEVVMSTLGLSGGQMSSVFPGWTVSPAGLMAPV